MMFSMALRKFFTLLTICICLFANPLRSQTVAIDTSDYIPNYYPNAIDYNMMIAASKGYYTETLRLLKLGAKVSYVSNENASALIFAVAGNHADVANLLIDAGSDVNIVTYKYETPLLIALFNSNFDLAESLIRHGANVNFKDNRGASPLHYAALHGLTDIADLLIYYEADIDSRTKDNTTPLMTAIFAGNNGIAELLAKNGANLEARDIDGFTPFLIAAQSGNNEFLKYLKDNGVDIYETNRFKWNALSLAIKASRTETVRELLTYGTEWNSSNSKSINIYQIAAEEHNDEVTEMLNNAGIDGHYKTSINKVSTSLMMRFTRYGYYNGLNLSFSEPVHNLGLSLGFDAKPTHSKVLFKVSDDLLYQYREKSYLAYAGIIKNFPITRRPNNKNLIFTTSLYLGYYFNNKMEGANPPEVTHLKILPSVGIDYSTTKFGYFMNFEYMKTDFIGVGKIWTRLGIKYNFYFDNQISPLKVIKWE